MSENATLLRHPKPWATPADTPAAVPANPPPPAPCDPVTANSSATTAPAANTAPLAPALAAAPATTSPPNTDSPAQPLIAVVLQRDLAVQLVGSDAGKTRRTKPHTHLVKGLSPAELAALGEIMQPFLDAEIRRVHEDKRHRLMTYPCHLTRHQAQVLKRCCLAYAAHVREHLGRHPGDSRYNRSQQRLEQATAVVDQINAALGTPFDDGLTVATHAQLVLTQAQNLSKELATLAARLAASPPASGDDPDRPLLEALLRLRPALNLTPQAARPAT